MITDEQARAAAAVWRSKPSIATKYDQAADTLEKWTRQELSRRTPPDDGPITAEWCREHGGKWRMANDDHVWWFGGICVAVDLHADDVDVRIGNPAAMSMWRHNPTRAQLLALLAALKGGVE